MTTEAPAEPATWKLWPDEFILVEMFLKYKDDKEKLGCLIVTAMRRMGTEDPEDVWKIVEKHFAIWVRLRRDADGGAK